MSENTGRFPKPWCVFEKADSSVLADAAGYVLTRVPFKVEGHRGPVGLMSRQEARGIADAMVEMTDLPLPTRSG